MRIEQVFSTSLVFHKNESIVDGLKKYILDNQPQGVDSNVGTYTKHNLKESTFDFFHSDESIIQESMRWFGDCLVQTVTHYYKNIGITDSLDGKYGVGFVDSWFHIGKKYSSHDVHNHGNCSWCGIFYVDSGDVDKGGETIFRNPINTTFTDCGNNYVFTSIRVMPENGKLLLFPSYLDHYQSLYTGDKDRIVIGFNMTLSSR